MQRCSVALTKLRGCGRECGPFMARRPLKMLKDMVDSQRENAQGHGGRPPLPTTTTSHEYHKGVLRVGVPSKQDLQQWAEQSQSSKDYKQSTLETFEAAPQWLAERRVNVKWKPLAASSDMERTGKSSICLWMWQISASPAVAPLSDVPKVVQSLY